MAIRIKSLKESEAEFQRQVIEFAKLNGWQVAHFRKVRVARKHPNTGKINYSWETPVAADGKGFLDLVLVRDRVVWIECKVPPNKLTPEQEEWVQYLQGAGEEVHVVKPDDWERVKLVLQ